jgi:recombination protein RecA
LTANHVKVKVVKNKLAPPFRTAEFDIVFGTGISKSGEIVDLGVEMDIIQKSGAWYAYKGAKIAQGREGAKLFVEDNPEAAAQMEAEILAKLAVAPAKFEPVEDGEDDE